MGGNNPLFPGPFKSVQRLFALSVGSVALSVSSSPLLSTHPRFQILEGKAFFQLDEFSISNFIQNTSWYSLSPYQAYLLSPLSSSSVLILCSTFNVPQITDVQLFSFCGKPQENCEPSTCSKGLTRGSCSWRQELAGCVRDHTRALGNRRIQSLANLARAEMPPSGFQTHTGQRW